MLKGHSILGYNSSVNGSKFLLQVSCFKYDAETVVTEEQTDTDGLTDRQTDKIAPIQQLTAKNIQGLVSM